jgi:hypothetical protein
MKDGLDNNIKDIDIDLNITKDFWDYDIEIYLNSFRSDNKRRTNDNSNPLIENVMRSTFWNSKISDSNFILEKDKPKDKSNYKNFNSVNYAQSSSDTGIQNVSDNENETIQSKNTINISFEEMNDLRDIYIAGNISGENIYDLEGKIIVKRNEKITKDTIKKAEFSGKLSELILNMRLDNFEKSL